MKMSGAPGVEPRRGADEGSGAGVRPAPRVPEGEFPVDANACHARKLEQRA
jgi:hypothetical protein